MVNRRLKAPALARFKAAQFRELLPPDDSLPKQPGVTRSLPKGYWSRQDRENSGKRTMVFGGHLNLDDLTQ
jgi:hypothetical protein